MAATAAEVVADQLARKADQDRRKGRQSRPIQHVPARRGSGARTNVRRYSVADRPATGAAGTSVTGRRGQMRETTTAEVRLDAGQSVCFPASTRPTGCFDS
jgi:hypothetical protein